MYSAMNNVLENINGHIHCDVPGYDSKYFNNAAWSVNKQDTRISKQTTFNTANDLYDWLQVFESIHSERLGSWQVTRSTSDSSAVQSSNVEFYISKPKSVKLCDRIDWTSALVIGNFNDKSSGTYLHSFLLLCQHAQKVFEYQPARLFLHGFLIYEHQMEPWLFDRSGIYSGRSFDIRQDHDQLKKVLSSYSLMDNANVGLNPFVREDTRGKYIMVCKDQTSSHASPERLDLEDVPAMNSDRVIGSGISLYRAKRPSTNHWELAVKFKWVLPETGPVRWPGEDKMLRLVTQRDVWGVTKLFNYYHLESTSDLRKDLHFEVPREFPQTRAETGAVGQSQGEEATRNSPTDILAITKPKGNISTPYENRTLACIIISPLGQSLSNFESPLHLLEAVHDAIQGHRDLYRKGILHQDVSVWNVMITQSRSDRTEPRGILIDLDLALELHNIFPDGRSSAGTPLFMAIEVLKSKRHTYRHDLESFLYVLLYTSICGKTDDLPENSLLQRWRGQGRDQLAAAKMQDMHKERFEHILREFDADFETAKPLARKLHGILFRTEEQGDSSPWTGTDESTGAIEEMYDAFENAFDEAIVCNRSQ